MALTQQTQAALAVLAQDEANAKLNVREIVADMKNSDFFRQNWDNLLIAAPNCLEILGNINLVAASPYAETTPLKGKFKYLTNSDYLKGALACISNQGNRSFGIARRNMTSIQMDSASVDEQVKIIYKGLTTPTLPMAPIMARLSTLKDTAERCHKTAKEIEDAMTLWSEFVYELYEVCNNNSASVEDQKRRTEQQLKLAKEDQAFREKQETEAKAELDKMNTHLTEAKESYKNALDSMPTGMELVGGQILMGLAEAAGTALNTYAAAANPVGGVGTASKNLSSIVKDLKSDTSNTGNNKTQPNSNSATDSGTKTGNDSAEGQTDTKKAAEAKKSMLTAKLAATFVRRAKPKSADGKADASASNPKATAPVANNQTPQLSASYGEYDLSGKFMTDDPAHAKAPAVLASIEQLKNIIVGLPTGINWDQAISKDVNNPSQLMTVNYLLGRLLKDFKPKKDALASQLLVATITEAIGVADELEAEAAKSTQLSGWEKPTRQSTVYKDWDERISRCHNNAVALDGAAQAIPGGLGTRNVSLSPPQQTTEEKIANMNYKQSIAEQTVKSATTKLNSTQQTYVATLDTYRKTAENLQEVKSTLQQARAEVASLDATKMNLEQVKKVLVSCIGYLIELKDRIRKLVVFFSNMTIMIEMTLTKQVLPFKTELELYVQINKTKAALYDSYYRDVIWRMVLQILSSFSLYKDVATMYLEVDSKVIQPGMTLVDRLSVVNTDPKISNEAFFDSQRKLLTEYNSSAEIKVHEVVKKKQEEIINGLQARIDNIGKSIDRFPIEFKPEPAAIEAAKEGAALTTTTAAADAAQPSGLELTTNAQYRDAEW